MVGFIIVNLASQLKTKPKRVLQYLKKSFGDKVGKEEVIAAKRRFLGKEIKVFSPVTGILEKLEESTGRLFIKEDSEEEQKVVTKKVKNLGKIFKGVFGCGKSKSNLIYFPKTLRLDKLKPSFKNKIIAAPKVASRGVIHKAAALGIAGLVLEKGKKSWLEEIKLMREDVKIDIAILCLGKSIKELEKLDEKEAICDGENRVLIFCST